MAKNHTHRWYAEPKSSITQAYVARATDSALRARAQGFSASAGTAQLHASAITCARWRILRFAQDGVSARSHRSGDIAATLVVDVTELLSRIRALFRDLDAQRYERGHSIETGYASDHRRVAIPIATC